MAYKKSEETKQQILTAAKELFNEKGYDATNIKDIAAVSGVVHSAIYYYFKNKENIARALFDHVVNQMHKAIETTRESNDDLIVEILITYLLLFEYIALNQATKKVYYELVDYSKYDIADLDRLRKKYYHGIEVLFDQVNPNHTVNDIYHYIITSDAFIKSLFKSIIYGNIEITEEEALRYFCNTIFISHFHIDEHECEDKLQRAITIVKNIELKLQ